MVALSARPRLATAPARLAPPVRAIVAVTVDLRLRCAVPANALARGGLTIYGAECGRYPVSPTVIIDW